MSSNDRNRGSTIWTDICFRVQCYQPVYLQRVGKESVTPSWSDNIDDRHDKLGRYGCVQDDETWDHGCKGMSGQCKGNIFIEKLYNGVGEKSSKTWRLVSFGRWQDTVHCKEVVVVRAFQWRNYRHSVSSERTQRNISFCDHHDTRGENDVEETYRQISLLYAAKGSL